MLVSNSRLVGIDSRLLIIDDYLLVPYRFCLDGDIDIFCMARSVVMDRPYPKFGGLAPAPSINVLTLAKHPSQEVSLWYRIK